MRLRPTKPAAALAVAVGLTLASPTRADQLGAYHNIGSFTLPSDDAFGVLGDGRLITTDGSTVLAESAAGSRAFQPLDNLLPETYDASGSAFARVSPDGSKIALGNNGGTSFNDFQVGVFNLSDLSGKVFQVKHLDAAWYDNNTLAITAGGPTFSDPSIVTALDTTSDAGSPVNPTIVNNIGGASAGITRDTAGRLFTGNGFDNDSAGTSETGDIKGFSASSIGDALSGNSDPIDFENDGTTVAQVLSGNALGFDNRGNLHVGGSASFVGDDFFALIDDAAIAEALNGAGQADPADARQLDPDPAAGSRYTVSFNPVTEQLYARSGDTVYTFAVPEPASLALLGVALGLAVTRRSRRA